MNEDVAGKVCIYMIMSGEKERDGLRWKSYKGSSIVIELVIPDLRISQMDKIF